MSRVRWPVESELRQARSALDDLVGQADWSAVWGAVHTIAARPLVRWPLAVSLALTVALLVFSGALGAHLPVASAQAITIPTAPPAAHRPTQGTATLVASEPALLATRALTQPVVHTPVPLSNEIMP